MKQATINKIVNNYCVGKVTHIGKFTYKLQFHPMCGKTYIVRCPKGMENKEFLIPALFENDNAERGNYWEWYLPLN